MNTEGMNDLSILSVSIHISRERDGRNFDILSKTMTYDCLSWSMFSFIFYRITIMCEIHHFYKDISFPWLHRICKWKINIITLIRKIYLHGIFHEHTHNGYKIIKRSNIPKNSFNMMHSHLLSYNCCTTFNRYGWWSNRIWMNNFFSRS